MSGADQKPSAAVNIEVRTSKLAAVDRKQGGGSALSIKAKLFLAFGGMAMLTGGASAVAWYAFADIEKSVTQITAESVVGMAASLRLAEKSAEITATAPALIASRTEEERVQEHDRLVQRLNELENVTHNLRTRGVAEERFATLIGIERKIGTELNTLSAAVKERLRKSAQRESAIAHLSDLHAKIQNVLEPLVDDAGFNLVISSEDVTAKSKEEISGLVEGGVTTLQALLTLSAESNLAAGLFTDGAHVDEPTLIGPIRERFSAAAAKIEKSLKALPQSPQNERLSNASAMLTAFGRGADNVFEARSRELRALDETQRSLMAKREAMTAAIGAAHRNLLEILTPMVDDASFELVIASEDVTARSKEEITGLVEGGVSTLQALLTLNAEANLAAGLLAEAAHVDDPASIEPIRERFSAAAATIEKSLKALPPSPQNERLGATSETLIAFGGAADNVFEVRSQELGARDETQQSLRIKRKEIVSGMGKAHHALLNVLTPMVDDAGFNLVISSEDLTAKSKEEISGLVEGGVTTLQALLTLRGDANLAAGLLAEGAHVDDPTLIEPIRERFSAAAATIEKSFKALPQSPQYERLGDASEVLTAFGGGEDNVFDIRIKELQALTETQRSLRSKREEMTAAVGAAHRGLLEILTPLVDDASFELVIASEDVTAKSKVEITGLVEGGVKTLQVLLTLRAESNLAAGLLNEAAGVPDPSLLQPLQERFVAAASHAEKLLAQLPASAGNDELRGQIKSLIAFGASKQNVFDLRREELREIEVAQASLQANSSLVLLLGEKVAELVLAAQKSSDAAADRTAQAMGKGQILLLFFTAMSVAGAVAIAVQYVVPRVVRPIESITSAMSGLAGGDTSIDVPGRDRGDEIGRMAKALGVFRDTAIEVQTSNLREISEGRRRLTVAIESISEAFSLYDSEDRLVVCNDKYRTLLYPGVAIEIAPGMKFGDIIRQAADRGYVKDAEERVEEWVRERMARHREPGLPHVQQRSDGRWILVSERKTDDGGTVAVYSDITEMKQRENELADKSRALEQLSSQLAKYLSPQVYESIFTGKQEVKITSRRKKLTVFFSDIAGFTETTERLQSEDLTRLLNHYLTEMSEIALSYGATVDKYVGDAIVIFFGDPETRGVKEDAFACVEMAIAMRKRMRDLQHVWRASGIERPLQCRIGINTGYSTVGNFGSEDRMDYTIIGAGVNLASRLEAAATPGDILVSYETYANVRDRIYCEEYGRITVKGIAYPVATYRVIDTYENLGRERRHFHEEHSNVKVDIDFEAMTIDDRGPAADILRRALRLLSEDAKTEFPKKTVP